MIIGITGGIGSGKSVVSDLFKRIPALVVDADEIARGITKKGENCYKEIITIFGTQFLHGNGEINRKKLAEIVFKDADKLALLNKITHKYVFEEINKEIENSDLKIIVLDIPLLFSCNFPIKCDLTIAVIASEELRTERVMKRDRVDKESVEARIKNQISNDKYKKLADICIVNDGTYEELEEKVKKIFSYIRNDFFDKRT